MTTALPIHDVASVLTRDSHLACDIAVGSAACDAGVDVQHRGVRETGEVMAFPGANQPGADGVFGVPLMRRVRQVVGAWVSLVAVLVVHLLPFGAWAIEGQRNEDVDVNRCHDTIPRQVHRGVTGCREDVLEHTSNPSAWRRKFTANTPEVRDAVVALESDHGFPNFHRLAHRFGPYDPMALRIKE